MEQKNNRKTMNKLLLVNWSRFQYEVINISGSTLFTGSNGSGKSTVLDAITYLLTGNTDFNIAAKDKDRNVKSYVRGDTKTNEHRYLRGEGPVVSYIAAEFNSPIDNGPILIGVVIESADINEAVSHWFILPNTYLEDVNFCTRIDNGSITISPRKELTSKGKRLGRDSFIEKKSTATAQILRVLGIRAKNPDSFRKKLMAMMMFDPQKNVDKFISDCILPEYPVKSLEQLKKQKALFEEARYMYQVELDGKKALTIVNEIANSYEKKRDKYLISSMILDIQRVKKCEADIGLNEKELQKLKQKEKELDAQQISLKAEKEAADERYFKVKNNDYILNYENQITSKKEKMRNLNHVLEKYNSQLKLLKDASYIINNELEWMFKDNETLGFNEDILRSLELNKNTSDEKNGAFIELINEVKRIKDKFLDIQYGSMRELENLIEQLKEKEDIIAKLNDNIINMPKSIRRARNILDEELKKQGIQTDVRTFAELVSEIKDENWRAAIETFLGYRRYDFIIDERYCEKVVEIIRRKKIQGVRVVYTDKLPDVVIQDNSAANQLVIPNSLARKYANYLLNKIHLCENLDELHEYPLGGITKDGMLAKGYAVSFMDISKTDMCLGSNAIELQKEAMEREKQKLRNEVSTKEQTIADCKIKVESIEKLDVNIEHYAFDAPKNVSDTKRKISNLESEIKAIGDNPQFTAALNELSRAKEECDYIDNKVIAISEEVGSNKNKIENNAKEKLLLRQKFDEAETALEKKKREHPEIIYHANEEYERLNSAQNKITVLSEHAIKNLSSELEKIKIKLEDAQLEYCKIRGIDNSRRGVVYIPWYRQEYNAVANVKMEECKNRMQEKEHDLQQAFMHDFIGEINEAIRIAKDEVDAINKELRKIPFGLDTYEFEMKPRADRDIFFRISKKIMEHLTPELYMAVNVNDEEMELDIKNFMNIILEEEDESEYTDYRKYYIFDMKMLRDDGKGNIVSANLSKKQGSASNGEKQTPYFIILAASLMQFYPKNTCCARLAFIDEAFAALSRERIEQMVKYFESHDFQVIYAAPPEKIESIGQYIDTTVSIFTKDLYSHAIEGISNEFHRVQ